VRDPFVSIIIPCYNHGVYLFECLKSVQIQTSPNWEAIIINDGCTDNSCQIGEYFVTEDSRFSLINQSNQGLSASRNVGINLAKGELLLFLDADDWLEKNCLSRLLDWILRFPNFELYRFGYSYWNSFQGNKYHTHLPQGEALVYPDVLYNNLGPCHSIVIKAKLARNVGGFDVGLKSCEDWDFWIRAGKMGAKIHSIPEVLVAYRYVPNSMSRNPRVMYEALTEVSRSAGQPDSRLPKEALNNRITKLDYPEIQKIHLITVLGVMLHQGKAEQARNWYQVENEKWNWKLIGSDWKRLSSYLSWGYFFERTEIQKLLTETRPCFALFFSGLGYSKIESDKLIKLVLAPQLKKRNHQKWGKLLGGVKNKLNWY